MRFLLESTVAQRVWVSQQARSTSFSVASGDIFGFYVASVDGDFGAGIATIYNFSGPAASPPSGSTDVPAPAALLGVFAAFSWSRKLRGRTLLASQRRSKSQAGGDSA